MSGVSKHVRIDSGTTLRSFLSRVIEEGVKSALAQKALTEKEKQDAVAASSGGAGESSGGGVDDLFGGAGGDESGSDDNENKTSKTMDDETEKLKQGDIKPKDIVDKLNAIRSGRSFKDSAVSSSMEEYINSLSKPEKVALFAFLKGISQIVTGEVPARAAEEPSDEPSDVEMKKGSGPEKVVHKKPNVIKGTPPKPKQPTPSGGEDTSAPAPITAKKR